MKQKIKTAGTGIAGLAIGIGMMASLGNVSAADKIIVDTSKNLPDAQLPISIESPSITKTTLKTIQDRIAARTRQIDFLTKQNVADQALAAKLIQAIKDAK